MNDSLQLLIGMSALTLAIFSGIALVIRARDGDDAKKKDQTQKPRPKIIDRINIQ